MLEEAGFITVDGGVVRLADDWLDRLDAARELVQELEADKVARDRLDIKRKSFHRRVRVKSSHHFVNPAGGADGFVEELQHGTEAEEPATALVTMSPLAEAIRAYLDLNPHDACQPPGWLSVTLWAYELYPGKPPLSGIRGAIGELGGEAYLSDKLRRARGEVA
jgi:hypothetical protein